LFCSIFFSFFSTTLGGAPPADFLSALAASGLEYGLVLEEPAEDGEEGDGEEIRGGLLEADSMPESLSQSLVPGEASSGGKAS
jgi:hypothetical protein